MDLSQEKIVFKAEKRRASWFIFLFVAAGLAVCGMMMTNLFFNPQMSYRSQQDFSEFSAVLAGVALFFVVSKAAFVQQFYVTETGIVRRHGISGKWSRINFDRMTAVAVSTVISHAGVRHPRREYRQLTIICRNHHKMTIPTIYLDESMGRVAVILANINIPVYQSIEKARHEAALAGYVMTKPAPAERFERSFPCASALWHRMAANVCGNVPVCWRYTKQPLWNTERYRCVRTCYIQTC